LTEILNKINFRVDCCLSRCDTDAEANRTAKCSFELPITMTGRVGADAVRWCRMKDSGA
jgi:hypothetical protein